MFDDRWTQQRIIHQRVDVLFVNRFAADLDAVYAKQLYVYDLFNPLPYVWGPNLMKVAMLLNLILYGPTGLASHGPRRLANLSLKG